MTILRKILLAAIALFSSCTPCYADNGQQADALWNGLKNISGQPCAACKVYTYDAGTTTPRSLYTTISKGSSATNPIILNSIGQALVYGDGIYKFIVKDSHDNILYTMDNLVYQNIDTTTVVNAGSSTGSSNAYVVTPSPAITSYSDGLTISFIANFTNSAAATLNVNGLGAKGIKRKDGTALSSADIKSGDLVQVFYVDGSPGTFRVSTVLNNFLPETDDTYDLGSTALQFKKAYFTDDIRIGGNKKLYTSNSSAFLAVGTNGSGFDITGGNGSYFVAGNNSFSSGLSSTSGTAEIISGNAADGSVIIRSNGATSGKVRVDTSGTARWDWDKNGTYEPAADDSYDIGGTSKRVRVVYSKAVIGDVTDGADNGSVQIGGSNNTRGGYMVAFGNENTSTGGIDIEGGAVSGGDITIKTNHASSSMFLGTNGANRLKLDASGHLTPSLDATYDLGDTSHKFRTQYIQVINVDDTAEPLSPPANNIYIYMDSTSKCLKAKHSNGTTDDIACP